MELPMSRARLVPPLLAVLILTGAAGAGFAQAAPETKPAEPPPAAAEPSSPMRQPGDAFGKEMTLPERTIVYLKGHTNWDSAFDTLVEAFKTLHGYLDKEHIAPTGAAMTIYTQTDETGFQFEAAYPIAKAPDNPPKGDIMAGQAPSGKALEFTHRGSYDAMDSTYEAITNYLDDHGLDAKDMFIEEYETDPANADPDKLVVHVFVPVK
jgi:effector-binding domain-containing protein